MNSPIEIRWRKEDGGLTHPPSNKGKDNDREWTYDSLDVNVVYRQYLEDLAKYTSARLQHESSSN